MNILLWVLQALLSIAFLAHGWLFLSPPAEARRADERVAASMVPALSRRGGSPRRHRAHTSGTHPDSAKAGHPCRRRAS